MNRVNVSDKENRELKQEIKTLQRIQEQQSKALDSITNENDYPQKIRTVTEDLRVQKEANRNLKTKLYEAEKQNRTAHLNMVGLE